MQLDSNYLLNSGIYTIADASRLTRVSMRRIRYWLQGREEEQTKEGRRSWLWQGQIKPLKNKLALGFLDLQEIRFVDAFLTKGVTWHTLRAAHEAGKEQYLTEHPFCTKMFVTDGKEIFDQVKFKNARGLVETRRRQRVFPTITQLFLKELKFSELNRIESWWPLGLKKCVVLDPSRQFGQPIVAHDSVPTEILFRAFKGNKSIGAVADWYEVSEESVRDSCDFELSLLP